MRLPEIARGEDAESQVPEARGDLQCAATSHEGLAQCAELRLDVRHDGADPTAPAVIVQPLGDSLGLTQTLERALGFDEQLQHRSQLEADVEGLLQCGLALRQCREDTQCLLEPGPGVLERRPRGRLRSGLTEIVHRLLRQLGPHGVVGEPLDLLVEAIPVERLDRRDDPRVKLAPALLQQATVCHVVRERVLERVLEVRKQTGLVEELGRLESVESATERLVWQVGGRLEQNEGHILANDGGDLQQALVLREEPVDARRQHRLDRGRDLDRLDRLRQPIPAGRAIQRLRLHQRPDGLFQEKRVAALDEELLERRQVGTVAEEGIQELPGALGRERVQSHLAVGRLAAPGVLILGTVVHEQQQARRAQALDQAIEECLGLAVDPSGGPRRSGGGAARALLAAAAA
jgi:hypothetical protein